MIDRSRVRELATRQRSVPPTKAEAPPPVSRSRAELTRFLDEIEPHLPGMRRFTELLETILQSTAGGNGNCWIPMVAYFHMLARRIIGHGRFYRIKIEDALRQAKHHAAVEERRRKTKRHAHVSAEHQRLAERLGQAIALLEKAAHYASSAEHWLNVGIPAEVAPSVEWCKGVLEGIWMKRGRYPETVVITPGPTGECIANGWVTCEIASMTFFPAAM